MRISDWSSDVCSSDLSPDKHVGDREAIVPDDVPADEDRDKGRLSCRNKPMFQEARPIWIVEHVAATGNSRGVSQVSRRSSRRRDDIGRVNGLILKAGSGVEQLLECILIRNDVIVHGPDEVRSSGLHKLETKAEPARDRKRTRLN